MSGMTGEAGARRFARLTLGEVAGRLPDGGDVLILLHARPDGDAVGSGFALKLLLEALGCRARCACADDIPERLRFLTDGMQDGVRPEDLPLDFDPSFILAVDTASPAQLGSLYATYGARVDLMIDHHGMGEMYADGWIDPSSSSAGEMVFLLSRALLGRRIREIPPGTDQLIYAAVSSDTGCFRYSNATPSAHRCAAELLGAGFDAAEINRRLFEVKSRRLLLAERLGSERVRLYADGRIGIVDFPFALKAAHDLADEHLDTLIDLPRSLDGVLLSAAVRQPTSAPSFRVSVRSSCDIDVARVCAALGGGGHPRAAGCTLTADGMEDAVARIARALERALPANGPEAEG